MTRARKLHLVIERPALPGPAIQRGVAVPFTTSQAVAKSLTFGLVLGLSACSKNPYLSSETRSEAEAFNRTFKPIRLRCSTHLGCSPA